MSPFSLRCPSCDHGNPAGAKFCNNCGLPVHLQPCSNCEAINDRTANRCYKCGGPLSLWLESKPAAAADTKALSSSLEQPVGDHPTPVPEPRAHSYDATIDEGDAAISGGAEHTITVDETLTAPPRQPAQQDFVVPATYSDAEPTQALVAKHRSPGLRAAVAAVMLIALAVPAYLAYQDPAQFRERLDAMTPRFDGSSDVQLTPSPQAVPVDNPASQQRETAPALPSSQDPATNSRALPADATRESQSPPLDAARAPQSLPAEATRESQSPALDATRALQLPAANTTSEKQAPPKATGESKLSSPETRATPPPQAAKNVRQSPVRSTASRSKQSNVSRTVVSPKASDARTRAKGSDARRSDPKEKAASRSVATRPGRSPAAFEPSPIDDTIPSP